MSQLIWPLGGLAVLRAAAYLHATRRRSQGRRLLPRRKRSATPPAGPVERAAGTAELSPGAIGVADECEHFLAGTYEVHLESLRQPVPLWARLNQVAHGDLASLVALASAAPRPPGPIRADSWPAAQAHMATELLRASARQGTVPSALQQDTLIPLESLIARHGHDRQGRRGRDPEQLLAIVTAALHSPPLRTTYDESA